MSSFVIVTNEVAQDESYLVEVPDGFDIDQDTEFGPLEYAQANGEYLGVSAEDFRETRVSRPFSSRAEALANAGDATISPTQHTASGTSEPYNVALDPQRLVALERRIAGYVLDLTPDDVAGAISGTEAELAAREIIRIVLAELAVE